MILCTRCSTFLLQNYSIMDGNMTMRNLCCFFYFFISFHLFDAWWDLFPLISILNDWIVPVGTSGCAMLVYRGTYWGHIWWVFLIRDAVFSRRQLPQRISTCYIPCGTGQICPGYHRKWEIQNYSHISVWSFTWHIKGKLLYATIARHKSQTNQYRRRQISTVSSRLSTGSRPIRKIRYRTPHIYKSDILLHARNFNMVSRISRPWRRRKFHFRQH